MTQTARRGRAELQEIAHQAMIDGGFEPEFPAAALAEAAALTGPAEPSGPEGPEGKDVRDLRKLLWASVDNDDSRDLDQLSVAEQLPGGAVRVRVAVADVDALVRLGSALDEHAHRNTTSIYTAARIFPMLPERLSTDLTSLNEGVDRLALVIEYTVGADGELSDGKVYRAMVHNYAQLAYPGVGAWLDHQGPMPAKMAAVPGVDEQMRLQDEAAQRLRQRRQERGALALETIEARPVFTDDVLTGLEAEGKNPAKELIEDFMIASNGVIATFLESKGMPSLRRVVRTPKRWPRIVEIAREVDEILPEEPDAQALAGFLARRRKADPLRFPDLSLAVVKLLGSGEYVVDLPGQDPPGHFGLAVRDYTHSTAPNRRYPDLITHRLVKAALAGRPSPYDNDALEGLARHCTDKEDDAQKVERRVGKSAAALLLAPKVGQRFDGLVTGASPKGTWVRVFHPPVEGRVVHGWDGMDVGERVHVKLAGVDVQRGFIDFVR